MDVLSHGLWGGMAFGRKSRKIYWLAFAFGLMPDFFSFGIFSASTVLGLVSGPDWSAGPPDMSLIPSYVGSLYNITHSLVVFAVIFLLIWLWKKKPFLPLAAWGLHILVDIPTHSAKFFPTPFLWPLSDYKFNGTNWGQPYIFLPNLALLIVLYLWWFWSKRKKVCLLNNKKDD